MKSLLFIYNPRSGIQAGLQTVTHRLGEIVNLFTERGYDVIVHPTQCRGDCTETVGRLAESVDRIVVAGGDGTLNEAVNGLMQAGVDKPYGYIPCGSTNDFSRSMGIPLQLMSAAENAVSGLPYAYDIGLMNERYFTYVAGFGAFTDVTYTTPQTQKNALGYFAYLISGAASLASIVPYNVRFETPDYSGEGSYILGLITNTLQVGGIKNLLPQDIALDDGLFEVIFVKNPRNAADLNKILVAALKHDFNADCFEYFKTSEITVRSEKPLAWTLDGESGGSFTETHITCHQRALSILTRSKGAVLLG